MPFALLGVGIFLVLYLQKNQELPILFVAELLISLLLLWVLTIFLIKTEYLKTLVTSLKKGYFTGAELFLDDSVVTGILLKKTESKRPLEVIHSLNLLERSGYNDIYKLLLRNLRSTVNAAGKAKNIELLPTVVELAADHHAYPSLRRAILYYGDTFFSSTSWQSNALPSELLALIIKTAGNIKGDNSTNFLVDNVSTKNKYINEIIEALWLKKTTLAPGAIALINDNIDKKIEQVKCKVNYYHDLINSKNLLLLQEGIMMEIRRDLKVLLKAFALLHDREKIDRVIELLNAEDTAKISNAIEILEPTIPKKYFIQLNTLVELIDDVKHHDLIVTKTNDLRVNTVISEILKDNKANFSEWTRSIACYILPKLKKTDFKINILEGKISKEDYLFNETRSYVLTMLK